MTFSEQRRKQIKRDQRIENGILGVVGVGCFLYAIGFIAFWTGVIYLIWHFALSH